MPRSTSAASRVPTGTTSTPAEAAAVWSAANPADPYRLPAVYPTPNFVMIGGLISYGPDEIDQYRRASGYVDRILKGAQPADLPVQAPTKYEMAINLKTAKALGLTIPETLLATADQVIE
jgi:putative tryptophan/tyrosine transport system substrate-binding protein